MAQLGIRQEGIVVSAILLATLSGCGSDESTAAEDGGNGNEGGIPDAAIDGDTGDAGRDAGCGEPPSGCCLGEDDCEREQRCYGTARGCGLNAAQCLTPPQDGCYDDRDCAGDEHCEDAFVPCCSCGAPIRPGTCTSDDISADSFSCGDMLECTSGEQCCHTMLPGTPMQDPSYSCEPLPESCQPSDATCDCFDAGGGSCSQDDDGNFTITWAAP